MKTKIKLTTSGLPIGKRTNLRAIDIDHAQTIIEYCGRGYHIRAHADRTPMWTVSFYEGQKGRNFTNDPDWVGEETRNIFIRPNYGNDDGRLYDDQPDWITQLTDICRNTSGQTIHWH